MEFEIAYKWVWLLLPLPLLVFLLWPALRSRRTAVMAPFLERAAKASVQRPKRSAWVKHRNMLSWIVITLVWCCLLAALSSPRYTAKPGKHIKTVRCFLIAADISFSMAETDWVIDGVRMSRWQAVRHLMKSFVAQRKSDRISLVVFGSNAYLQAPLTTDLSMINWLLDETEVGMAGQMTNIGDAIAYSVSILKADTLQQKVMLLLTDGVDTGTDLLPLDAAHLAKNDSIKIYTMGIGKTGGHGGYELDEKTLRSVAHETGGQYFNVMNEGELKNVYSALDKLTPVEYQEDDYKPVTLLYYYPLAAALLLVLLFQCIASIVAFLTEKNVHV